MTSSRVVPALPQPLHGQEGKRGLEICLGLYLMGGAQGQELPGYTKDCKTGAGAQGHVLSCLGSIRDGSTEGSV